MDSLFAVGKEFGGDGLRGDTGGIGSEFDLFTAEGFDDDEPQSGESDDDDEEDGERSDFSSEGAEESMGEFGE